LVFIKKYKKRVPMQKINLDTQIEDLATAYPESVKFLIRSGVRCIRCGEPVWGTLGELLKGTGIEDPDALVIELNAYIQE
jgi:methionine synthase II (cobalamin-independent)